jgi:predicted ATPase
MPTNQISKVTRKNILISLLTEWIRLEEWVRWFFNFEKYRSSDDRYKTLEWDYYQHRVNNLDWEDDRFITDERLNILGIDDQKFLKFLCQLIHPEFELEEIKRWKSLIIINNFLLFDGYEIVRDKKESWHQIYKASRITQLDHKEFNFYFEGEIHTKNIKTNKSINKEWKSFPCVIIYGNDRNDYWFYTQHFLYFCTESVDLIFIGWIKILQKDEARTKLSSHFKKLNNNYCSILDEKESYNNLKKYAGEYYNTILHCLNDVIYSREVYLSFKDIKWFKESLLRESATYALILETYDIDGNSKDLDFTVSHQWQLLNIDFKSDWITPSRIKAIIGKNGCWKTRFLLELAKSIVQYEDHQDYFITKRPKVNKVISISYSAFDDFYMPSENEEISYVYCWLRKDTNQFFSKEEIEQKFFKLSANLREKDLINKYKYYVKDILDGPISAVTSIEENFRRMSSGQKILALYFWEIMIHISHSPNSLLLFDEPETHLHPNMIFKLVKSLYKILETEESYAIIATHSPIIIQQVPSKNILIFENYEWVFASKTLHMESLGENFSSITKEIFGNYEEDDIYYIDVFKDLMNKGRDEKYILKAFPFGLSLNARIYLKNLFDSPQDEEN